MSNFLGNFEELVSMVNSFLVGDLYNVMKYFNCFFFNIILGMGGLIDVVGMVNLKLVKKVLNCFGSMLGYYNVGYGFYVVLLGYGSFMICEDGGNVVDYVYLVLSYLIFWMLVGKWMLDGVEICVQLLDLDGLLCNFFDLYLMVCEVYF